MAPRRYNIKIQGKIYWKLVAEYDNSLNDGKITHEQTLEKKASCTFSTFRQAIDSETKKAIQRGAVKAEAGASYSPVSASVSAEYDSSKEINDLMENATRSQTEEEQVTKSTFKRTLVVEIGPWSKLILYQQWFSAAGVDVESDVISTNPERGKESKIIDIDVVIEEQEFIKDVKVVYSDQASGKPDGRVLEYTGRDDDINAGAKGKCVSLVPVYTNDIREAAVSFENITQGDASREGLSDITKGDGGAFRYLVPYKNERDHKKIYELALGRFNQGCSAEKIRSLGYDYSTYNINAGRDGDVTVLYLLWKSKFASKSDLASAASYFTFAPTMLSMLLLPPKDSPHRPSLPLCTHLRLRAPASRHSPREGEILRQRHVSTSGEQGDGVVEIVTLQKAWSSKMRRRKLSDPRTKSSSLERPTRCHNISAAGKRGHGVEIATDLWEAWSSYEVEDVEHKIRSQTSKTLWTMILHQRNVYTFGEQGRGTAHISCDAFHEESLGSRETPPGAILFSFYSRRPCMNLNEESTTGHLPPLNPSRLIK
ncbi:uncharacterized protein ARMOST_18065 [Armillaria ostoyae]|uniref:Uncharacterized protein n=1 Tax=Armillaria ostoyae TaxID=47428 RepID=A0A284S0R8_ARMOS|nr:uncharacterized protein ARMOST_18065 [Armillaria ostoyae]